MVLRQLNNILLIMHQIAQVLAITISGLEQLNRSMLLLLLLQVLQAWLEVTIMSFKHLFHLY